MASNGHLAFRLGFDRTTGGTSGFYLERGAGLEPFVALDEADSDGVGDRLNSINPVAALNASDHLAFIASESAGDARNGIFFAAPTTMKVGKLGVRAKERNVKGIPTVLASMRARVDLAISTVGKALQLDKQAVKVTVSDADGPLFTASVDKGAARPPRAELLAPEEDARAQEARRHAQEEPQHQRRVRDGSLGAPVPIRRRASALPSRCAWTLGVHSGTAILSCTTADGGNAQCPAP
jgi:hypothetical protein